MAEVGLVPVLFQCVVETLLRNIVKVGVDVIQSVVFHEKRRSGLLADLGNSRDVIGAVAHKALKLDYS